MSATTNPLANYAPFILNHLADVVDTNAPETKVTPTGFLRSLIENDPEITMPESEKLRLNTDGGQIKQIRLSYLRRLLPSQTSTTDDCANDFVPVYSDFQLDAASFRKVSLFISDDTIAHYMADAAATTEQGKPATPLMNEHIRTIRTYANGLLGAIDKDLIAAWVPGVNAVTGLATARTINIEKDATKFDLTTGWAQLLDDLDVNEVVGAPIMSGGAGLFNAFVRSKGQQGNNFSGLTMADFGDFKWYYDQYAKAGFGTNSVCIYSKGSMGFVDLNKFVGFRSGQKGISYFFQITLPVMPAQNDGTAGMMKFDAQLKYIDCPTQIFDGYNTVTVNRGWQLILSKNFGLFQIPTGAYQAGDVLNTNNNGSYLYTFTNNV